MNDLDDLLFSAKIENNNAGRARTSIATRHDLNYRQCFTRAENWQFTEQVQLINVEGNVQILLGLYDELVHKFVPKCRRLVQSVERIAGANLRTEKISGCAWLPHETWVRKHAIPERKVAGIWDLVLDMGQPLEAQTVQCVAVLAGGGFQTLLLEKETLFAGNTPRTILSLPAGLDVLECLTQECRVALWKELNT